MTSFQMFIRKLKGEYTRITFIKDLSLLFLTIITKLPTSDACQMRISKGFIDRNDVRH